MKNKSLLLEVITPEKLIYSGEIEMLIVKTLEGMEGFMAGHTWACKLLAEDGLIKIRKKGEKEFTLIKTKNGYVDIKDHFVVYTDDAKIC